MMKVLESDKSIRYNQLFLLNSVLTRIISEKWELKIGWVLFIDFLCYRGKGFLEFIDVIWHKYGKMFKLLLNMVKICKLFLNVAKCANCS